MTWEFLIAGFALGILTMTILNLYKWACSSAGVHWAWQHAGWKEKGKKDYYGLIVWNRLGLKDVREKSDHDRIEELMRKR